MKSVSSKILLVSAVTFMSLSALALKDDTNQPINIVSDNQSLDMSNRVVTFTDNVVITQGSIVVKANKVIITRPEENSKKKDTPNMLQEAEKPAPNCGRASKIRSHASS